jgi:anti-sigma factor RsiW
MCRAASLALQHGCLLDTLWRALLRDLRAAARRRRSTPPPPNRKPCDERRLDADAPTPRHPARGAAGAVGGPPRLQFAPNSYTYGALAQIELILVRLAIAIIDVIPLARRLEIGAPGGGDQ